MGAREFDGAPIVLGVGVGMPAQEDEGTGVIWSDLGWLYASRSTRAFPVVYFP